MQFLDLTIESTKAFTKNVSGFTFSLKPSSNLMKIEAQRINAN